MADKVKVGDWIYYRHDGVFFRGRVLKITKTGRIKLKGFDMNPDLSIRGRDIWSSYSANGEVETPELLEAFEFKVIRNKLKRSFQYINVEEMTRSQAEWLQACLNQIEVIN